MLWQLRTWICFLEWLPFLAGSISSCVTFPTEESLLGSFSPQKGGSWLGPEPLALGKRKAGNTSNLCRAGGTQLKS